VKIDRSFVQGIGQPTNLAIVRAVIGIADSLAIKTTAEGVETEEQYDRVAQEDCDEVQGYLFSPPLPAAAARTMARTQSACAAALRPAAGRLQARSVQAA
jgi:EAL domain-containing protein (putative c-di-GMP-specific phosphodiesterase class I)